MNQVSSSRVVTQDTLEGYRRCWSPSGNSDGWDCLFMIPPWIEAWLEHFAFGGQVLILKIAEAGRLPGFAPLLVEAGRARLIGSQDVCDYLDFIGAGDSHELFFAALIEHLRHEGIKSLDLCPLRPGSAAFACCSGAAAHLSCDIAFARDDVSYELALPQDWDAYLAGLTVQQRHEVRRKLRRLEEAGPFAYRVVEGTAALDAAMDAFLYLFTESRQDKKDFMTPAMEAFFRSLARSMAACGLLRLGFLDFNGVAAASVMCFDYRDTVYLYNSGFDPRFRHLNAGLLCKVLSIRDSIERGKKVYDFLKGAEPYKQRLGGRPVPLQRLHILLSG